MKYDLILIDISNLTYQMYYGLGYYKENEDLESMVKNTINLIENKIEKLQKQGEVYLIFDTVDDKNKRLEIYPEYKSGRNKRPETVDKVLNILANSNYNKTRKMGLEADDVIAKIVIEYKDKEILIVSSDKDLEALLRPNVKIEQKGHIITEKDIKDKLKTNRDLMEVIQIRKALMGDSSDNIKGVSGIGKVKSLKMINDIPKNKNLYEGIIEKLNDKEKEEFIFAYKLIKFQI